MFNGRLHQRSLRTHNKDEATKLEAVFRAALVRGEFGIIESRSAPTLIEFEERLLAHVKANTAGRTYGFYAQNIKVLKRYVPLATTRLGSIDSALIESFIQWRLKEKVTPVTVNHSLRTLKRLLHIAKEWKLIRDVPTIKLLPGEHEREAVIDETLLQQMVEACIKLYPRTVAQWLFPFLCDTGLRISEACNLLREHVTFVDLHPVSIRVVKGKTRYSKREIPLTARAASCLEECLLRSKSQWVFAARGGKKPMTRHYPSEIFRTIRSVLNLGPETVLHSARHTFCTRLGNAGADAFTIQKLAGHSSILISQRYVHPDKAAKQSAIKLLDLPVLAPLRDDKVKQF
jgi:integrase